MKSFHTPIMNDAKHRDTHSSGQILIMLNVSLSKRHLTINKKSPLFPDGTIAFVSTQLSGGRVDARIDPRMLKKKREKKREKNGGKKRNREKIHKNWQCCEMIGRLCSHGRRVSYRGRETTVAGRSESVFAPGCPRQIFGADALWVTPGGGQLRRRGQSMLAISCSLRGAVMPGTIVIDKS